MLGISIRGDSVRISPHVYNTSTNNTSTDIDRLVAAIASAI
jgi:selenocysteine lyase/cysteine desulfurase